MIDINGALTVFAISIAVSIFSRTERDMPVLLPAYQDCFIKSLRVT